MKIGILTFWKTEDNYGQLLQCYATQAYLHSLGHETFLVKAITGREYNPTFKGQLFSKLRTLYRLSPYPFYLAKRATASLLYTLAHGKLKPDITNRGFEDFRKIYLNCTPKEYTLEELTMTPPSADAFIVGSDQIWNTTTGLYFLSWVKEDILKVSMAASFGSRDYSDDFGSLITPWLQRFDLITVRENSGLEICSKCGIENSHLVPDPTLLLRADDYLKIASKSRITQPYLFIYFLGTRTKINWKEIHAFAKSRNLKIVYVGSQGQEDKFHKEEPTVNEWLSLMTNADYVITNSFHGTVFAIQFRKQFMVLPVTGVAERMNGRLTTLLNPLGLSDHIYSNNLKNITMPIDYDDIFSTLDKGTDNAKNIFSKIFSPELSH